MCSLFLQPIQLFTDGHNILHTLLVKHYNDFLDSQSSGWDRDEVTYLNVGVVFCIYLDTM